MGLFVPFGRCSALDRNDSPSALRNRCRHLDLGSSEIGSGKVDPVRFTRGFEEGLLKDNFAFFLRQISLVEVLCLTREKLLAKQPFLRTKSALF